MCLVSIIIPNFNGEKTLKETINSIVNQSYDKWEIIIVDDGSTDESHAIINNFSLDKIHYIQRPTYRKKGGNTCRNIGIDNSKGEYLIFLDSDDILASYCIERRIQYMEKHPYLDFAVFNTYRFIGNIKNSSIHTKLNTNNPLLCFLGLNCLWQTTSPIWKKSFVNKIRFNEDFQRLQDPEMTIRALSFPNVKYKLVVDSTPDSYYRISKKNKGNKKRNVSNNYSNSFMQFVKEFYPLTSANEDLELSKKSLFYQLTQSHIFSADKSNINDYVKCIKVIAPKLNKADILIFNVCKNKICLCLLKNRIARKLIKIYYSHLLHKIWGNLYIHY